MNLHEQRAISGVSFLSTTDAFQKFPQSCRFAHLRELLGFFIGFSFYDYGEETLWRQ